MIKVQCACGQKLQTGDENAGRYIRCPKCRQKFQVAANRSPTPGSSSSGVLVESASQELPAPRPPAGLPRATRPPVASAPRPPAVAPQRAADPAAEMPEPAMLFLDEVPLPPAAPPRKQTKGAQSDDLLDFADEPPLPAGSPGPPRPAATPGAPLEYVRDARHQTAARGGAVGVVGPPAGNFWLSALQAFLYPIGSAGNAVSFFIAAAISACRVVLGFGGIFGMAGRGFIFGWMAAVYMNTIAETCSNNDDFPGVKMEEGPVDDIFLPALRFLGTFLTSMLPAIAFFLLSWTNVLPASTWVGAMGLAWFAAGVFAWPMTMLLFSLGIPGSIFRLDLVVTTVARTVLPYLTVWLFLLLIVSFTSLTALAFLVANLGYFNPLESLMASIVGSLVVDVIGTYLMIVAMRVIGLYYRYYKHRFAFKLE